jgi:hypothetical protein
MFESTAQPISHSWFYACQPLSRLIPSSPLTSGGGPTGLTILSNSCTLVFSLGCPIPMLMYCSSGGWPTYEDSESRAMFDVHSCLVVSAEPIPMKRAWRASSCCWARSLSAMVCNVCGCVGGLLGVGRVGVEGGFEKDGHYGQGIWSGRHRAIDKDFTVRVQRRIANRCRNTNNSTSQISSTIQPSKSASHHSVLLKYPYNDRHPSALASQTPYPGPLLLAHIARNRLLPTHSPIQRGLRKRRHERHPPRAIGPLSKKKRRRHAHDCRRRPPHPHLSSHLRTHPSPIPGLFLTHENGYHTGGIGPSAHAVNEFAQRFVEEKGLGPGDVAGLDKAVRGEVEGRLEEVRSRMKKRERAVKENERVLKELEDLRLSRQAELKVLERIKGKK